jgi:hypothetical protein
MSKFMFTAHKVEELLELIKKDPDHFLIIGAGNVPKSGKAAKCIFHDILFNINGVPERVMIIAEGNIVITRTAMDPADKADPRTNFVVDKTNNLYINSTVSNAGPLGEFLKILNGVWKSMAPKVLSDDKKKGQAIHEIVQTITSEQKGDPKPIDDPIIYFKVDFDKYPTKYPLEKLRDQPKSTICDFVERKIKDANTVEYPPALVNGNPLDLNNAHEFITRGSVIKHIRLIMDSAAVSTSYFSVPLLLNRAIIEHNVDTTLPDQFVVLSDDMKKHIESTTTTTTTTTDITPANLSTMDDIKNALQK